MSNIIYYMQTDPKWSGINYSAPGESTTIGRAGCGPTSAAMVIASWVDKTVTPKTTVAWSLRNGYKAKNQGTYYSYFAPQLAKYGIKCYQVNSSNIYGNANAAAHQNVKDAIKAGHLVIACMGKGNWTSTGHFVLLYNVLDGCAYINDPNSTKSTRTKSAWSLFASQVKYYFICEKPKAGKPETGDDMTESEVKRMIEKSKPKVYNKVSEMPEYYRKDIQEQIDVGALKGDQNGDLRLTEDMIRVIIIGVKAEKGGCQCKRS